MLGLLMYTLKNMRGFGKTNKKYLKVNNRMHKTPNYNFKTKEKKQQQKQINNEPEQYFLKMTNNKKFHAEYRRVALTNTSYCKSLVSFKAKEEVSHVCSYMIHTYLGRPSYL